MEYPMSQVPNVEDPVQAVILERLDNLRKSFEKLETKVDDRFAKTDAKIEAVQKEQADVKSFFTTAKGGYIVLVGLGAMLMWALGAWDKLAKLWQ
jgi:hypothetical protein